MGNSASGFLDVVTIVVRATPIGYMLPAINEVKAVFETVVDALFGSDGPLINRFIKLIINTLGGHDYLRKIANQFGDDLRGDGKKAVGTVGNCVC